MDVSLMDMLLQQLEMATTYLNPQEGAFRERLMNLPLKHDGQMRKSGEPYIIHPVAVTKKLRVIVLTRMRSSLGFA
ncbi:MAG: hypothetical protein R2865_05665 [Deinococcales bacterium]